MNVYQELCKHIYSLIDSYKWSATVLYFILEFIIK